jgi:hypothetical protein
MLNKKKVMKKSEILIKFWHGLTSPNPFFNLGKLDKKAQLAADQIREFGYVALGKVVSDNDLLKITQSIDNIVNQGLSKYSETSLYHLIPNPLLIKEFFFLANLPIVVQTAEAYFKRKVFLADVDSRRIPPVSMEQVESNGLSSSNWHRDTRGRQVKIMIYLTDVSESDSNFSFYPKTHDTITYGYENSRFEEDFSKSEPIEWYGKAGEAMMFDTNVIHRLRRKALGRTRDSVTFYYTPGQHLRKIEINKDWLSDRGRSFFIEAPFWSKRT